MRRTNGMRARRPGSFAGTVLVAAMIVSAAVAGAPAQTTRNGKLAYTALLNGLQLYSLAPETTVVTRLSRSPAVELRATMSPDGTRIAFVSQRDGNWEIYVANSDGTDARRITNDPASDYGPAWSPDSRRIAFESDRDSYPSDAIYVINADGSGLERLTTTPSSAPAWSPDGRRIAFVAARGGIHVMNPDGTEVTRITSNDEDDSPSWSPNGAQIAFSSVRTDRGHHLIFVMNSDGTDVTRITSSRSTRDVFDSSPTWSPDGSRIAFDSFGRGGDDSEIYVVGAAGTGPRQLTRNTFKDFDPNWSPDGRVLFTSDRSARVVIQAANPDGSGRRTIVSSRARDDKGRPTNSDMRARWSPNGTRLVLASSRDGDADIYVVASNGSRLTQLTHNRVDDVDPAWSPNGREIVFIRRGRNSGADHMLLMRADGSNVRALRRGQFCCLDWSRDGRQIAFSLEGDIAVIPASGPGMRIVAKAGSTSNPSWAPDSRRIVFTSDRTLETDLYIVSSNGARPKRLKRIPFTNVLPDWSPDGRLIAFSADGYLSLGTGSVYLLSPGGTNLRRVPLPVPAVAADWQPRR